MKCLKTSPYYAWKKWILSRIQELVKLDLTRNSQRYSPRAERIPRNIFMVDGPAADAAQAAGKSTVENLSLTSANLLDDAGIFSMGWPGCFSTAAGEKSS